MTFDKEKLRDECRRLMAGKTISDSLELADIFLEYFFKILVDHHDDKVYSQADADAKMINQMMFTKLTHLKRIIEGIGFESKEGKKLNAIIDPTIVVSLVRNIYESVALFNLIFVHSKSKGEKDIIYSLWVVSGLKYRQRFASSITRPENEQKLKDEDDQIKASIKYIEDSDFYKALSSASKDKIQTKLKERDYKVCFENNEVKFLSWQDLSNTLGCDEKLFGNIYTYFSLYSHPSHVAVFQFGDMFGKENEDFKKLTATNLKFCFTLLSAFTADFIKVFPQVKSTFEKQTLRDQIMLNFHNKMVRGDRYSINEAWRSLE